MHFAQHTNSPPNPQDSHKSLCLCAFVVVAKDGGGGGGGGDGGGSGGGSGRGGGRGCEPTFDAAASTASLAFLTTAALSFFNFSFPFLPMMGYLINANNDSDYGNNIGAPWK